MNIELEIKQIETIKLELSVDELHIINKAMWALLNFKCKIDAATDSIKMQPIDTIQGFEFDGTTYNIGLDDVDRLQKQLSHSIQFGLDGKLEGLK